MFLRNGLEPWHLIIVVLVLVLVFGSKRLPDTAKSLGQSLRILKAELKEGHQDDTPTSDVAPPRELSSAKATSPAPATATPAATSGQDADNGSRHPTS